MFPVPWYLGATQEARPMSVLAPDLLRAIERIVAGGVSWS